MFYTTECITGYGYAVIPETPGTYEQDIELWKPMGDYNNNLKEFFLGVASQLKDIAFVYKPIHTLDEKTSGSSGYNTGQKTTYEKVLNRVGVVTESIGITIRLKLNIAMVDTRNISNNNISNFSGTRTTTTNMNGKSPGKGGDEKTVYNAKPMPSTMQRSVDDIISDFKTNMTLNRLKGLGSSKATAGSGVGAPIRTTGAIGYNSSPPRPLSPSKIMSRPGNISPSRNPSSPSNTSRARMATSTSLADVLARVREKTGKLKPTPLAPIRTIGDSKDNINSNNMNMNTTTLSGVATGDNYQIKGAEVSSPLHAATTTAAGVGVGTSNERRVDFKEKLIESQKSSNINETNTFSNNDNNTTKNANISAKQKFQRNLVRNLDKEQFDVAGTDNANNSTKTSTKANNNKDNNNSTKTNNIANLNDEVISATGVSAANSSRGRSSNKDNNNNGTTHQDTKNNDRIDSEMLTSSESKSLLGTEIDSSDTAAAGRSLGNKRSLKPLQPLQPARYSESETVESPIHKFNEKSSSDSNRK